MTETDLSATAPDAYPFAARFRVRYSEIDGQQIVFNAHYLTWYDTALAEYFRHLQISMDELIHGDDPTDFHTVRNVIDYHAPVRYDEIIAVHVRPGRLGRSSVTFEMATFVPGETRPRNTGQVVWVAAGVGDHQSKPVPDWVRQRLEVSRQATRVEVDPTCLPAPGKE